MSDSLEDLRSLLGGGNIYDGDTMERLFAGIIDAIETNRDAIGEMKASATLDKARAKDPEADSETVDFAETLDD